MNTEFDSTEIILEEFETDSLPSLEELMAELERDESVGAMYVVEPQDIVLHEAGSETAVRASPNREMQNLAAENEQLTAALTRANSDFENYRRRIERERGDNYAFALKSIVTELLPVLDNFRLALANAETLNGGNLSAVDLQHYFDGFDLIRRQFEKVLSSLGVEPVAAVGEVFDPHVHEAVAMEANGTVAPNTVLAEVQRGYQLGKRLIRPAMVKVSTKDAE